MINLLRAHTIPARIKIVNCRETKAPAPCLPLRTGCGKIVMMNKDINETRGDGLTLDQDHERAWRALLRAHALLIRRLDADLRECCGMTLVVYDALVQLSEAPDQQLRMSHLADSLVHSRSGLTRIVNTLEEAGWATRVLDPCDRRSWLVRLTPSGLARLEEAWHTHVGGVSRHFAAHMSASEAQTLTTAFRGIIHDLSPHEFCLDRPV